MMSPGKSVSITAVFLSCDGAGLGRCVAIIPVLWSGEGVGLGRCVATTAVFGLYEGASLGRRVRIIPSLLLHSSLLFLLEVRVGVSGWIPALKLALRLGLLVAS